MPLMRRADVVALTGVIVEITGWLILATWSGAAGVALGLALIALGLFLWEAVPAPGSPESHRSPLGLLTRSFREARSSVRSWEARSENPKEP